MKPYEVFTRQREQITKASHVADSDGENIERDSAQHEELEEAWRTLFSND